MKKVFKLLLSLIIVFSVSNVAYAIAPNQTFHSGVYELSATTAGSFDAGSWILVNTLGCPDPDGTYWKTLKLHGFLGANPNYPVSNFDLYYQDTDGTMQKGPSLTSIPSTIDIPSYFAGKHVCSLRLEMNNAPVTSHIWFESVVTDNNSIIIFDAPTDITGDTSSGVYPPVTGGMGTVTAPACNCGCPPAPTPPAVVPPVNPPVPPSYNLPGGISMTPVDVENPVGGKVIYTKGQRTFSQPPDVVSPNKLPKAPSLLSGLLPKDPDKSSDPAKPIDSQLVPNGSSPQPALSPNVLSPQAPLTTTSPVKQDPIIPNAGKIPDPVLLPQAPLTPN